MKRRIPLLGLLVLLAIGAIVGMRFTSNPDQVMNQRRAARAYVRPVDTQPLINAQQLDKLAVTR